MRYLKLLVLVFLASACGNDEPVALNSDGPLTIQGRIVAPNATDPVPFAEVQLISGDAMVTSTKSDAKGQFILSGVNYGSFVLNAKKGLFNTTQNRVFNDDVFNIDLGDILLDGIPQIAVVTGTYDNIEKVLYDIGLVNPLTGAPLFDIIDGESFDRLSNDHPRHNHTQQRTNLSPELEPNVDFDFEDLLNNPNQLASYDILFLNCGLNTESAETSTAIFDYVHNGGILYATDWAYPFLEQINSESGTEFINFMEPTKSGISVTTEATILSSELNDWLSFNFDLTVNNTVVIDEFIGSWQVVESYDSSQTTAWLDGPVEYDNGTEAVTDNKELAFTFLLGNGGVFYSSFHTENDEDGFSCVDRVMEYMVFELATIKD